MLVHKDRVNKAGNELKTALNAMLKPADNIEDSIAGKDDATVDSSDKSLTDAMANLQAMMTTIGSKWQALLDAAGATGVPAGADATPPGTPPPAKPAPPGDMPVADDERLGFSQFLSNVGQAMLDTQKQLDTQSLRYLQDNLQNRHVLPSIFRLPKLSAEMKFALEVQKDKGVNLIFFKNQSMAKEMHQQSITFDLVSAPPPPDALSALQSAPALILGPPPSDLSEADPGAPINITLVLDPAERKTVLDVGFKPSKDDSLPDEAEADPDRVVILGVEPARGYMIFYAGKKGKHAVGVWLYSNNRFRAIYKFDDDTADGETFLRKFVSDLAADQQRFLKKS